MKKKFNWLKLLVEVLKVVIPFIAGSSEKGQAVVETILTFI